MYILYMFAKHGFCKHGFCRTASTALRYRFPSDHRSQAPLGLVTTRMGDRHLLGKPSRCTKKAIVMVRGLLQPRTRVMRAHTRSRWQGPFQSGGIGPGETPLRACTPAFALKSGA